MSLSAAVTRILTLSGFPPELKTRDIQAAFSDWENERGGFKIKWVDDTSLMLVFMDAGTAKRAYLSTLFQPPPPLAPAGKKIIIKPYDGPEAQQIIQNVNSRGQAAARGGHGSKASVSNPSSVGIVGGGVGLGTVHRRAASTSYGGRGVDTVLAVNGPRDREPSPTLPNLPSQPSLNALISSGLNDLGEDGGVNGGSPPKVGDPARRMVGHALGIRHPTLGARGVDVKDVEKSMGGLAIMAE